MPTNWFWCCHEYLVNGIQYKTDVVAVVGIVRPDVTQHGYVRDLRGDTVKLGLTNYTAMVMYHIV